MSDLSDIARLNVLIELFSECANATDLETLLRVAAGRLRWVLDFEVCTFVLDRGDERHCWQGTPAHETLEQVRFDALPALEAALARKVMASAAPAGEATRGIGLPIQASGRMLGALCVTSQSSRYTYRDLRLGHHAGQFLGSLLLRLDLEEETQRFSRRKDELLAILSHELRNPLAPIVTAAHLLRLKSGGKPSRELDVIERQSSHLVRLVDDLLDVARMTRGKLALKRAHVELARVLGRAVDLVGPLLKQRGHQLTVEVPALGLQLDGDEDRLTQVFSNLLTNAAHYTPEGGHLGLSARRDGEQLVAEVWDDGIGISVEALPRIFEPFAQGTTRPSGQGGLGLGLVVVKELTELHGGTVAVESGGVGRGTRFTIRLPALPLGLTPVVGAALAPAPAAVPQRLLLVDDNEDALDLLSMVLQRAGHEVVVAHSGAEALAALEGFQPTAAFIDLGMPGMDGHLLATRIRARCGVPPFLVALTGSGQTSDREQSRQAGFDAHLVKPVDLAHLLRVIAGVPTPLPLALSLRSRTAPEA